MTGRPDCALSASDHEPTEKRLGRKRRNAFRKESHKKPFSGTAERRSREKRNKCLQGRSDSELCRLFS
jgi:hypothetical protein